MYALFEKEARIGHFTEFFRPQRRLVMKIQIMFALSLLMFSASEAYARECVTAAGKGSIITRRIATTRGRGRAESHRVRLDCLRDSRGRK